jgi:DNA-binding response OmpR family regulator
MEKILVVEDEYAIRNIISEYFKIKNVEVVGAMNGYEALEKIDEHIELVLLDIMMPGIDGYEVCQRIKEKFSIPVIFISALSEEENQLKAYELGADDYLTKPFKSSILYAKCIAVYKRYHKTNEDFLKLGCIEIDLNQHLLIKDELAIPLSAKEYELLVYLCKHEGKVIHREVLLNTIWGYDYYGDGRAVDTYIKKLRKKLVPYDHYIQTIVKTGYMFKVVN